MPNGLLTTTQIPSRPDGSIDLGDIESQSRQTLDNLRTVLEANGSELSDVAHLAIYLTDWKFDHTPVDGRPTDTTKIAELGARSPLVLLTDCVRVEAKGYTPSEQTVGEAFDNIYAT